MDIIDVLYDSDTFRLTELETVDDKYKATLDRLISAERALKASCADCESLFEEYQTADIDLHNHSNRNEFRLGFRVGAQLVLEMLKAIK